MQRVLDLVSAHLSKSDCSTGIWLPYEINQDDKWAFTDGSEESLTPDHFVPPKWLGWSLGQPNGQGQEGKRLEKCVAAYKDRPELFDTICDAIGYCYVCTFEDMIKFSILGACSHLQDIVDVQYIVDMEKIS